MRQLNNKEYIVFELPQDTASTRKLLERNGIAYSQGEGCYKGKINPSFIVSYRDAFKVLDGYFVTTLLDYIFHEGEECVLYLEGQKFDGSRGASLIYDKAIKDIGTLVGCGSTKPIDGDYSKFNGVYYQVI